MKCEKVQARHSDVSDPYKISDVNSVVDGSMDIVFGSADVCVNKFNMEDLIATEDGETSSDTELTPVQQAFELGDYARARHLLEQTTPEARLPFLEKALGWDKLLILTPICLFCVWLMIALSV